MSNAFRLQINEKELGETGDTLLEQPVYTLSTTYEKKVSQNLSLPSVNTFVALDTGSIVTGSILKLTSTEELTVELNGGSQEITQVKSIIFFADINAISVKNTSGSNATVTYELYGG